VILGVGCVATLEGLHQQQVVRSGEYREQIALLTELCVAKDDEVHTDRQHLVDYKKHVALTALNSRSGKPIPPQVRLSHSLSVNSCGRQNSNWIQ